jgi:hypothetical protein
MFSQVSGQCEIGTRCQRWREAPIITVSTTARSAHYHGVSGFTLAARALPSRLGLRPWEHCPEHIKQATLGIMAVNDVAESALGGCKIGNQIHFSSAVAISDAKRNH